MDYCVLFVLLEECCAHYFWGADGDSQEDAV